MEEKKTNYNKPLPWIIGVILFVLLLGGILSNQDNKNLNNTETTEINNSYKQSINLVLSGNGSQLTDSFYLPKGLVKFNMSYAGNTNFSIKLLDSQGDYISLLVNEIGNTDISQGVKIDYSGQYFLNVSAGKTDKRHVIITN